MSALSLWHVILFSHVIEEWIGYVMLKVNTEQEEKQCKYVQDYMHTLEGTVQFCVLSVKDQSIKYPTHQP